MTSLVEKMRPIKIGYWNMRGLSAPLRMMAFYAQIPFECDCYAVDENFDRSSWTDKKAKMLEQFGNPFLNLPYLIDGDKLITQTNACFTYLARKTGMWSDDEDEITLMETLLCELMDLRGSVVRFAYSAVAEKAPSFFEGIKGKGGSLAKLERHLEQSKTFGESSPFLVAGRISAPDFHFYELLLQIDLTNQFYGIFASREGLFEGFPCCLRYMEAFGKLPRMQPYLNSKLAAMALNNLTANFGSLSSGEKWEAGKPLPESCDGFSFAP